MKKIAYSIILIIFVMITACQSTIVRLAGMRQPEIESKSSILEFLHSIKQDTLNVYTLDTIAFRNLQSEPFKPGWEKGFRPVQIRVYDSSGKPVLQWASCEGYLDDLKTFDSVPPKNINGLNPSWTLEKDLSQYFTLNGSRANLSPEPGYNYHILVYFAKYFPKFSKQSFRELDRYVSKHPDLKIKIYRIDVDFQDFWGIELDNKTTVQVGG